MKFFTALIFPLCLLLSPLFTSAATQMECEFFIDTRNFYGCDVKTLQINSIKDRSISEVTGSNLLNKSFSDVVYFASHQKIVKFFPRNLENFFPKLQTISIYNSSLEEIEKKDLQPFWDLRKLMLYHNKIEVIQADLFEFTPKLILICLQFNRIKFVESGAFEKLPNLVLLHFHSPCKTGDGFNRRIVKELIGEIYENCNDRGMISEEERILMENEELKKNLTILENKNKNLLISCVGEK